MHGNFQKWNRENDQLPKHLQREEPKPPDENLTKEELHEYAWATAQVSKIPLYIVIK